MRRAARFPTRQRPRPGSHNDWDPVDQFVTELPDEVEGGIVGIAAVDALASGDGAAEVGAARLDGMELLAGFAEVHRGILAIACSTNGASGGFTSCSISFS